jgi:hypothetical protein
LKDAVKLCKLWKPVKGDPCIRGCGGNPVDPADARSAEMLGARFGFASFGTSDGPLITRGADGAMIS